MVLRGSFFQKRNWLSFFSCLLSLLVHIWALSLVKIHVISSEGKPPNVEAHITSSQILLDILFESTEEKKEYSFLQPKMETLEVGFKIFSPSLLEETINGQEKSFSTFYSSPAASFFSEEECLLSPAKELSKISLSELFPDAPKPLASAIKEPLEGKQTFYFPKEETQEKNREASLLSDPEKKESIAFSLEEITASEHFSFPPLHINPLQRKLDLVDELGILQMKEDLKTISWNQSFEAEVDYYEAAPDKILFAVTFLPKKEARFAKLAQNIYFLMDTSNSIQTARLQATKNAIHRSLSYLSEEDRFNLVAFDNRMLRFSSQNLPPNAYGKKTAREFLQEVVLGTIFSSGDPYKALRSLLHEAIDPDAVSTVILITNGDGLGTQRQNELFLQQFSQQNRGKLDLFCLGMHTDEKLASMETLALFNKGELYTSSTKGGLKRKLCKLIKSIHYPIAKEISAHACSKNKEQIITLFPSNIRLKNLYADAPFVLLGETNTLEDFTIVLQGKHRGESIQIKKSISFAKASKGNKELQQEWALENAIECYQKYFFSGEPKYAKKALEFVNSYDIPELFP